MKKLQKILLSISSQGLYSKGALYFQKNITNVTSFQLILFFKKSTSITSFHFTVTIFKKLEKYYTVSAHCPTVLKQLGKCETSFCSNRQISITAAAASDV